MVLRLIQSILLLMLVGIAINAQIRNERETSLQERALKLQPYIDQSARRYGIDPRILRVLCFLESRYRLDAISPKGARGPMQFMPSTASKYGLQNPHDPKSAIDAGARYLRDLLRKFNGRVDLAVAAYNAGEGAVEAFMIGRSLRLASGKLVNPRGIITGGIPPYSETQQYVHSAISLLMNKPVGISRPSRLPLRTGSTSSILIDRDFSLDVMSADRALPARSTEKAKAFFIEIQ
jgi:soluble lytic murein transglycosylase-like protein